jgi:hypothetical protein
MKFYLTVLERIKVLNILMEAKSSYAMMKLVQQTIEKVGFDSAEIIYHKIEQCFDENGQPATRWSEETADEEAEIEIDDEIVKNITETLKRLDEQKQIGTEMTTLYEKFVVNLEKDELKKKLNELEK